MRNQRNEIYPFSEEEIKQAINNHQDCEGMTYGIFNLKSHKILTKKNLEALAAHENPNSLASQFIRLNNAGLLTDKIRELIAANKNESYNFSAAIIILHKANILTDANLKAIDTHIDPQHLLSAISIAHHDGSLTQEYFNFLAAQAYPFSLSDELQKIRKKKSLKQRMMNLKDDTDTHVNHSSLLQRAIASHPHPESLKSAVKLLETNGILTEKNLQAIMNHDHPTSRASAIVTLQSADILSDENLNVIEIHPQSSIFVYALHEINKEGELTQECFDFLAVQDNPYSFASKIIEKSFEKPLKQMPDKLEGNGHHSTLLKEITLQAIATHPNPDDLNAAIDLLEYHGILTQENLDTIMHHLKPKHLAFALSSLNDEDILSDENRQIITINAEPYTIANILIYLKLASILTDANRQTVVLHHNPKILVDVFLALIKDDSLTQENFDIVVHHADPESFVKGLITLNEANISSEENRQAIAKHASPHDVAQGFVHLHHADILTDENRKSILTYPFSINSLISALYILIQQQIFNQDNLKYILNQENPESIAYAMSSLHRGNILTNENREMLSSHPAPSLLAEIYVTLNHASLLTHENRQKLISLNLSRNFEIALDLLKGGKILTQKNFDTLVNHMNFEEVIDSLCDLSLKLFSSINQEEFDVIVNHENPKALCNALSTLRNEAILKFDTPSLLMLDIKDNQKYLNTIQRLPEMIQGMVISKKAYDAREKALNQIVKHMLAYVVYPLTSQAISPLMEFLGHHHYFRLEALDVIKDIPHPNDLISIPHYDKALKQRTIDFKASFNPEKLSFNLVGEQGHSLWSNQKANPVPQQNLNKQYGV